ncbi:hypothetical protein D9M68_777710 [compost metagenome]
MRRCRGAHRREDAVGECLGRTGAGPRDRHRRPERRGQVDAAVGAGRPARADPGQGDARRPAAVRPRHARAGIAPGPDAAGKRGRLRLHGAGHRRARPLPAPPRADPRRGRDHGRGDGADRRHGAGAAHPQHAVGRREGAGSPGAGAGPALASASRRHEPVAAARRAHRRARPCAPAFGDASAARLGGAGRGCGGRAARPEPGAALCR